MNIKKYYKSLLQSYKETKFTLKLSKNIYIENLELSNSFKWHILNNDVKNFHFITSYNPCSISVSDKYNNLSFKLLTWILSKTNKIKTLGKHKNFDGELGYIVFNTNSFLFFLLRILFFQVATIEYKNNKLTFNINYINFFINFVAYKIKNGRF